MAKNLIEGQTSGLRSTQIKALERIYRRKIPPEQVITGELARFLTEQSQELRRQVGVLIDRQGTVQYVLLGDDRELMLPDLSGYGLGRSGLRGLRLVHTHIKQEPLSQDDINDLSLLRLDLVAAIGVGEAGAPGRVEVAHLLPPNPEERQVEILRANSFYQFELDFATFIRALDREFERHMEAVIALEEGEERGILISVSTAPRLDIERGLDELTELARTADVVVLDRVIQRAHKIHPRFLMGEGKLKEVVIRALQRRATLLVFDQDLTPGQVRAIGALTDLKVIDRSQLILDIFARRAHTLDGKVQVELAQLKYILPRLTGRGTAMSRLMGGIGGRGPGETKLETDRRRIRDRIRRLEKQLKNLSKGRRQRRQKRIRGEIPVISIVGYTNAGKSTLLNALTQSEVFTENLLFATLDTSSRRLRFPNEREVIITDTVGFIRDLPESLFGAFRATLEEMEDADLILHLVDLSNPQFEVHIQAVEKVLEDLSLQHTRRLLVFNKIDLLPEAEVTAVCRRFSALPLSARQRKTFQPLLLELERLFWPGESELLDI